MMYDLKALYEAESVEHAVALLMEHPEAQIIAGGSDVLVQMREGKRAGKELVSIYGIDAMRGVSFEEDGAIRIGSLTSFSHITKDPIIQKYINVLGEAVDMVGGPQIRAGNGRRFFRGNAGGGSLWPRKNTFPCSMTSWKCWSC